MAGVLALIGGGKRKESFSMPLSATEPDTVKLRAVGNGVRGRVTRARHGKHNGRTVGAFGGGNH